MQHRYRLRNSNIIHKTQNKALRIINFKEKAELSDPFFTNHKILKLQSIIALNKCLFIYQIYDNLPNY